MVKAAHISTLTGLRAFAAYWVVLVHNCFGFLNNGPPFLLTFSEKVDWGQLGSVIYKGYYAVDFFFILSGFVIFYVCHKKLSDRSEGIWAYGVKRFARIYPVHAFIMLILAILYFSGFWQPLSDFELVDFLLSFALLEGFVRPPTVNMPAWTISAEFFAYILFLVLLPLLLKVKGRIFITSIILIISILYGYASLLFHDAAWCSAFGLICTKFQLVRVVCGFVIGCLLYKLYAERAFVFEDTQRNELLLWGFLILNICVLYFDFPIIYTYSFFAPLIYYIAVSQGAGRRFFGNPVVTYLGKISYSIYLVHYPVLEIYRVYLGGYLEGLEMGGDQLEIRMMLVAILLSVTMAAVLLYHCVEEPSQRFIRRRFLVDKNRGQI